MNSYGPEFHLTWPREVFAAESRAIASIAGYETAGAILLEDAFDGPEPKQEFERRLRSTGWGGAPKDRTYLTQLANDVDQFPTERARYWNARTRPDAPAAMLSMLEVQREWAAEMFEFQRLGFLSRVAPKECVDGEPVPPPDRKIESEVLRRAGLRIAWPLTSESPLGVDDFYTLVEVIHDLVARPRLRYDHTYGNCGWHFDDYVPGVGQGIYRWKTNALFAQGDLGLALADSGEDRGRLVRAPGDDRDELVLRTLERVSANANQHDDDAAEVRHAIAQFRARGASRLDKRAACVSLSGVLERRRQHLKDNLLKKDEGALFQIANEFAIRHQRADQKADYADDYLDWVFWVYLSTIELTDRIVESQRKVATPVKAEEPPF
ncbi:hypothetical protein AFL01nite_12120 [Aeromicrobium flavum]|uniref:Uncharacterized protein n=2 Tax=Aeromicrobium TaxID=2040 RepID=A0A512HTX1_9ACTN|nr:MULTISPECIES: hypothetical protein [Aeromicrobium]MBA4607353.1 hypothetical protein [Aeromicrobium phoceense]GEO88885.1 hypothetical protein AFL01nite_12120 [Aeromicrobium flavum]